MKQFIEWVMDYPECAAIGMCVGAALGLVTEWLLR